MRRLSVEFLTGVTGQLVEILVGGKEREEISLR
jgi:hypothetical protein